MKKILLIILTIIISINLFGCKKEESKEVAKYEFEYKFKEEYSDKISSGLAGSFIDFTRDTLSLYVIGFEDFGPTVESEFSEYMGKIVLEYGQRLDKLNEDEKEVFELMIIQWDNATVLNMLKLYHGEDEKNKSMGIKTKYTDEYYEEQLEELRARVEDNLEKVKKFID